jgi:glycosyltransferase involved in cell wall biosynthesis
MKILYITYDGILEPLGQSQVLAYQEQLSQDFDIFLFSYEKPSDLFNIDLYSSIKNRISQSSIEWIHRKYHKSPSVLATFYDLVAGVFHCSYIVWKNKIKIIHARSYPPALIALVLKKLFGIKFIFDMRGFWADERVDGNLWNRESMVFKITKALEKSFILNADHIVSLTHVAVDEINKFPYIENISLPISVIPTCVDLNKFIPRSRTASSKEFTLGYLGTVGTWYLFEETVRAFAIFLSIKPNAKILIVNKGEHDFIVSTLLNCNVPLSSVEIKSADHSEVPHLIRSMDATIFFLKPLFSKQAAAPTKLGEFLASGVPCLTNQGVGDMASIINTNNIGKTINEFTDEAIRDGIFDLIQLANQKDIIQRCVQVAEKSFSLKKGVVKYADIYNDV